MSSVLKTPLNLRSTLEPACLLQTRHYIHGLRFRRMLRRYTGGPPLLLIVMPTAYFSIALRLFLGALPSAPLSSSQPLLMEPVDGAVDINLNVLS